MDFKRMQKLAGIKEQDDDVEFDVDNIKESNTLQDVYQEGTIQVYLEDRFEYLFDDGESEDEDEEEPTLQGHTADEIWLESYSEKYPISEVFSSIEDFEWFLQDHYDRYSIIDQDAFLDAINDQGEVTFTLRTDTIGSDGTDINMYDAAYSGDVRLLTYNGELQGEDLTQGPYGLGESYTRTSDIIISII